MASLLQNLFVRALNPESVRSLKMVMSHASLYFGIILYTAVGAKVDQLLYLLVIVLVLVSFWCTLVHFNFDGVELFSCHPTAQ